MSDEKPAGEPAPTTPPPVPAPAPPASPSRPPIDFAMPAPKRPMAIPKHAGCIVKMLFGFVVLLLMGYFALVALSPKARQWATSKKGPTPFKAINQILAIPAQAVGKTKDVVVANDARVGVLDKVIAEEEGRTHKGARPVTDPFANVSAQAAALAGANTPGQTGAAPGKPDEQPAGVSREVLIAMQEKLAQLPEIPGAAPMAEAPKVENDPTVPYSFAKPPADDAPSQEPAPPAPVKLPGGIVISNASPEGAPAAGPNFLYWVVNLNISGVFQSNPHRILMNNRLVYEGDEINHSLGITFVRLEPASKLIVFRDKTGALVTRSY